MKHISLSALLALAIGLVHVPASLRADTTQPAPISLQTKKTEYESFAQSFAQTVLAVIQDTKKSYADRKDNLRMAFAKSVDIDWIAKFVLGKNWTNATEEQREQYKTLYKKFLTETYVANFADNPDKRIRDIKIFGVNTDDEAISDENNFTVNTVMMLADSENLNVKYLVCEREGKYKVRDIAIENISLITTHRSEFNQLASGGGIASVITHLEKRLKNPNTLTVAVN